MKKIRGKSRKVLGLALAGLLMTSCQKKPEDPISLLHNYQLEELEEGILTGRNLGTRPLGSQQLRLLIGSYELKEDSQALEDLAQGLLGEEDMELRYWLSYIYGCLGRYGDQEEILLDLAQETPKQFSFLSQDLIKDDLKKLYLKMEDPESFREILSQTYISSSQDYLDLINYYRTRDRDLALELALEMMEMEEEEGKPAPSRKLKNIRELNNQDLIQVLDLYRDLDPARIPGLVEDLQGLESHPYFQPDILAYWYENLALEEPVFIDIYRTKRILATRSQEGLNFYLLDLDKGEIILREKLAGARGLRLVDRSNEDFFLPNSKVLALLGEGREDILVLTKASLGLELDFSLLVLDLENDLRIGGSRIESKNLGRSFPLEGSLASQEVDQVDGLVYEKLFFRNQEGELTNLFLNTYRLGETGYLDHIGLDKLK